MFRVPGIYIYIYTCNGSIVIPIVIPQSEITPWRLGVCPGLWFPPMRFPRADFPMQTNLPGPIPKGVFYVEKFSSQHFSQKIKRNIPNLQRRCGNRTKSSPWKVGCFPQKLAVNTFFSRAWVLDSRLLSKGTLYNSPCQATRNLRVFNGWFRCSIDLMMTTLALRSCQSCDTWGQSPDPRSVGRTTSSNPGRESNPVRFEKYKPCFFLESELL